MNGLSRRNLLKLGLAATATPALAGFSDAPDVHKELLELAARREAARRARFAAPKTPAEVEALREELRRTFLELIGGLPESSGPPRTIVTGRITEADYEIEKLTYESFPGYFVPALLYRPRNLKGTAPGVLSPCGHSTTGKAAEPYQTLHINLAKRGFVVLTFDPVGQGERSQFWDAERRRTRYNLVCGEHAVLGNPLYLIGSSLARYRVWDGMRGIDYLIARADVDPTRIGCVGNSGGGNLTAYITALDSRVAAAAICCYVTTLPKRMATRIQKDPDSDPEQDVFGLVGEGVDHAGLLALCAPRPTLLGTARFDFFPIEGARESFEEAATLYRTLGAPDRVRRVEAPEKHGLTITLREAVYGWFDRYLARGGTGEPAREIPVRPRPATELLVCPDGQANTSMRSRHLFSIALEEFARRPKPSPSRENLLKLLRIEPDRPSPRIDSFSTKTGAGKRLVLCVNGNETPEWRESEAFLRSLDDAGFDVAVVHPSGSGAARPALSVPGSSHADPLSGVEENIAYNAFLLGRSLIGIRVSDLLAAVRRLIAERAPESIFLCGRRDAGLVAAFAAAIEPRIDGVALEEIPRTYRGYYSERGEAINAASILPGMLRDFGDLPDVLAQVSPRRVFLAAPIGAPAELDPRIVVSERRFTESPRELIDRFRA